MTEDFTSEFGSNLTQPGNFTLGEAGVVAPTPPGFWPSVDDVAALMRARTRVTGGKNLGSFNESTVPRDDQVLYLIGEAADEVLGKVQPIDPTLPVGSAYNAPGSDYERRIGRTIALYTAILIEVSYWPEQTRSGQSPVTVYQQLYDERIRALIAEGEHGIAEGMGEGAGGAGDAPADAAWGGFPDFAPGAAVGWSSRWLYDPDLFASWERLR